MSNHVLRQRQQARYLLIGELITETGLHVGSGYGNERTDATVVRDYWDRPYIPGSSLKGALRSAVERLIGGIPDSPVTSCQLTDGTDHCLTTNVRRQQQYSRLQEANASEDALMAFLESDQGLCDTCWLFGSPYTQSRLSVADLPLLDDPAAAGSEIRHGVGIDRDTLTARDRIKFDYETLPSQLRFSLELVIDRPAPLDLALLSLALQELSLGFIPLGGIKTRGLGRCRLSLADIRRIDLASPQAMIAYLTQARAATAEQPRVLAGQALDPAEFISEQLAVLQQAL